MRKFKHKLILSKDLTKLKHATDFTEIPIVKNRVLHIDGDFLAYMVSYDDTKSLDDMKSNCDAMVEKLRSQAGAESVVLHLTHSDSNKGNRYNIALQKEYQGNRKSKAKPKYLNIIRKWMEEYRTAQLYLDKEADDGMAMAVYKDPQNTMIATKDKDLCIVPGAQINWDTGAISESDNWGYISLDKKINKNKQVTYKVSGRGWKFFWAQVLMGDTADNIQGLPWCIHEEFTQGKLKRVGPVLAYNILNPVESNSEAFKLVKKLFRDTSKIKPFVNYRNNKEVSWIDVLISEMKLLWMRRNDTEDDVLNWLKETT